MTAAPGVDRIANVTALVGNTFEPRTVDLEIADGRIAGIVDPEPHATEGTTIDGTGLLAFPGMIDSHDHLRTLTPGLASAEGLVLDDFLKVLWAAGAQMGREEYRIGALLGSVQRLRTGITTIVDHCYTFHAPELDEASIAGYEAAGTRWMYARGIMTRPYEPVCETWDAAEAKIRELVEGGVVARDRFFVAPVSIRQARPEEFARARGLADDLGVGLYTHVAETADEVAAWQGEAGASPIAALDALGFLTDRTILVHCVHLAHEEIDLLARRGTHVVHCPSNNMKLAKGFTPVPDLLSAGVNVALGVDMMVDLLTEMRTEIGMQAAHRLDPNAVSKVDAMRMATCNGARALGWEPRIGLIEAGRRADVVLLEARSILQAPLLDPVYTLLYATDPGMVRHVLIDGRWMVRDGRSTLVDEQALIAEAEAITTSYLERIGADQRLWFDR
jgi:5-methylthioadenosine/S-adenosylhomocysteine deaminase